MRRKCTVVEVKDSRRSRLLGHAALGLALLALYGPAFWGELAHPDDISVFRFHLQDGISWWTNGWTTCGRWLQGLIHLSLLPACGSLADFRLYRILGFLGLLLWNWVFESSLRPALPSPWLRWTAVAAWRRVRPLRSS